MAVRTERFWKRKLDYIHANPVRKGLVQYPEDWRFSFARHYATGDSAGNDVNITQITW